MVDLRWKHQGFGVSVGYIMPLSLSSGKRIPRA